MKKLFLLFCFILLTNIGFSQCVKGGDQSKFPANPESKLNANFKFDYQIYSTIEVKTNGEIKRYKTHYYVNSQDGSLFFPKGIAGMNGLNNQDEHFRFDGAVWLSNRQMVIYGLDKQNDVKRAMTVASNESASNRFMNQHLAYLSFFNDRNDSTLSQENPEPLPSTVDWDGITHGYTGNIYSNSSKAKLTLYLDEHPMLYYKTSVPLAGFLTGILNFFDNQKCNALVVFSKIEQENGDYIQEELYSINPEQKNFNGTSYKPFGLLKGLVGTHGNGMQNMQAKMAAFQAKQMALSEKIHQLQEEKKRCNSGGNHYSQCSRQYDPKIKKAKDEAKKLQYDLMKKMGAEDLMNH